MTVSRNIRVWLFRASKSYSLVRSRIKIMMLKKLKRKKDKDFHLY